jgi:hypothetical protein
MVVCDHCHETEAPSHTSLSVSREHEIEYDAVTPVGWGHARYPGYICPTCVPEYAWCTDMEIRK